MEEDIQEVFKVFINRKFNNFKSFFESDEYNKIEDKEIQKKVFYYYALQFSSKRQKNLNDLYQDLKKIIDKIESEDYLKNYDEELHIHIINNFLEKIEIFNSERQFYNDEKNLVPLRDIIKLFNNHYKKNKCPQEVYDNLDDLYEIILIKMRHTIPEKYRQRIKRYLDDLKKLLGNIGKNNDNKNKLILEEKKEINQINKENYNNYQNQININNIPNENKNNNINDFSQNSKSNKHKVDNIKNNNDYQNFDINTSNRNNHLLFNKDSLNIINDHLDGSKSGFNLLNSKKGINFDDNFQFQYGIKRQNKNDEKNNEEFNKDKNYYFIGISKGNYVPEGLSFDDNIAEERKNYNIDNSKNLEKKYTNEIADDNYNNKNIIVNNPFKEVKKSVDNSSSSIRESKKSKKNEKKKAMKEKRKEKYKEFLSGSKQLNLNDI